MPGRQHNLLTTCAAHRYHAKRNEFDPDYDAEAELPLAEMEFAKGDAALHPEEHALKCRMLMIYNERLNERARRKVGKGSRCTRGCEKTPLACLT